MKRKKKLIIAILTTVLLAALVVVCNVLHSNSTVRDLRVELTCESDPLLEPSTLRSELLTKEPTLLSLKVKEVNEKHMARLAEKNPYVESARVSVSLRGDIVVRAIQRVPVARIITSKGERYLSYDHRLLPPSQEGEADVLVANQINLSDSSALDALWQLATFLYDHPTYGDLFSQASFNSEGDLLLVPLVGDHIVVVGGPDNLEKKLADLLAFYRKGLPQVGWNTYKQISLKYNGQIICKKR